ncbi:MAG: hypothetical protein E4G98_02725 [Promethearchaeota archaeon]|nr:MAG: hypothetical protein E4G98_02725 [Candidatus Lokiarchaeota archaeon]
METENLMEEIFKLLDQNDNKAAVKLIKTNLIKRDPKFIEDLVPSLNIITNTSVDVVENIMSQLLGILNLDDDVIRYSIIISLKKFVEDHKELIFPYVEDNIRYGSPKKRESMLRLLKYVADSDPKSLVPFYDLIISCLSDPEEFVRKNTIQVLESVGKADKNEIEARIFKFLKLLKDEREIRERDNEIVKSAEEILAHKKTTEDIKPEELVLITAADRVLRKDADGVFRRATEDNTKIAADEVLKKIVDVKSLEQEELERREREAQSKALKEKLADDEKKLELEKLQLEEEQAHIEEERIHQEKERLTKEKELNEKRQELERVRQELELKRLEEEKNEILEAEEERVKKRLQKIENDDKDAESEEN